MKKSWPKSPVLLAERFCALRTVSAGLLTAGVLKFSSRISAAINSIVSQFLLSFTAGSIQAFSACKFHNGLCKSLSGSSSVMGEEDSVYNRHAAIVAQKLYTEGTLMKKFVTVLILLATLAPLGNAALERSALYESSYYSGTHDRSFNLGSEGILDIHLEFAVYRDETLYGGTVNEAQLMQDYTGYTGDADYVYAYQVFCEESSTAALDYFALTGINPSTISDINNDISEAEFLDDGIPTQSGGKGPSDSYFNSSVTKAIWEFEGGAIAQGEQSWFLFLYSDYDWIRGDMEIRPSAADDDIPVPEVPEPATLVLLAGGALLSLKRKK